MGELYYGERIVTPLSQGVSYLIDLLKMKDTVKEVKSVNQQTLKIIRKDMYSDIILYIVDAYVLGEGATFEILKNNPSINAILVLSNWNEYTPVAKELAQSKNVALFTFKELMGAIYYNGENFINYTSPQRDRK